MAKNEIRNYGPGKFHRIIDSYAYELTLDGGADREESYEDGGGWYGFIELDSNSAHQILKRAQEQGARSAKGLLTDAEMDLINESAAIIFYERTDGTVEATWFDNMADADEAWAEIEEEFEGLGDDDDSDDNDDDEGDDQ